jgi:hypothetical protein
MLSAGMYLIYGGTRQFATARIAPSFPTAPFEIIIASVSLYQTLSYRLTDSS